MIIYCGAEELRLSRDRLKSSVPRSLNDGVMVATPHGEKCVVMKACGDGIYSETVTPCDVDGEGALVVSMAQLSVLDGYDGQVKLTMEEADSNLEIAGTMNTSLAPVKIPLYMFDPPAEKPGDDAPWVGLDGIKKILYAHGQQQLSHDVVWFYKNLAICSDTYRFATLTVEGNLSDEIIATPVSMLSRSLASGAEIVLSPQRVWVRSDGALCLFPTKMAPDSLLFRILAGEDGRFDIVASARPDMPALTRAIAALECLSRSAGDPLGALEITLDSEGLSIKTAGGSEMGGGEAKIACEDIQGEFSSLGSTQYLLDAAKSVDGEAPLLAWERVVVQDEDGERELSTCFSFTGETTRHIISPRVRR